MPTMMVEASVGVKKVVLFILRIHGMCWESMWRLWPMMLEEFLALVVFH
jgi:hypothetical protein